MNVLTQKVIKLNTAWQVIGECNVEKAILDLFAGAVTAMYINGDECYPVSLSDWLKLPLREGVDIGIRTSKMIVREPHVVVCIAYNKIPKRRPRLNLSGLAKRDGNRCGYTGLILPKNRQTIDHIHPRSLGGKHDWENTILADRDVNHKKSNLTLAESGLKLIKQPRAPLELVPAAFLEASHPDHALFLKS